MADYVISQVTLLDGKTVELKDAVARAAIQGGTYFLGVTTTALTDGSGTSTITIAGESKTAVNGNMAVYGNKEFIWASADNKWHELGDLTNLGALALKDSASGTYTPTGTVAFTGASMTSTGSYTPAGSVAFTGANMTSTGTYTPAGSVSKPNVDVTPTTANIAEFDSAGSVTAGVAASATLPTWGATVSGETLIFSWNQGSFTPNTPTAVTLPTSKTTAVVTGVEAALHAAPAFTGTEATLSVDGTTTGSAAFTGTAATLEVSGTTTGSAAFTGTEATITVT